VGDDELARRILAQARRPAQGQGGTELELDAVDASGRVSLDLGPAHPSLWGLAVATAIRWTCRQPLAINALGDRPTSGPSRPDDPVTRQTRLHACPVNPPANAPGRHRHPLPPRRCPRTRRPRTPSTAPVHPANTPLSRICCAT
jgi:hypothetical protein